ncbi:glutamine-hydrolyzing carbamoyl-phosphate synthase small subunit [Texcoconibacillus texcoconensis]|uniref:Carbamoyl phosphate synthase small chain n=1 Tax=Texcoconibacillus texcoconensis TaxID=1095777 RepID=A0A840QLA9_9BACI|nr:glutamine-hydrolyzing carbamoyl-phosphate synthase small subunit [Texcoconibacillus texcoconensis]MBB5172146.1 carbamoyl-phosphate synthase small subunit [Texcoconibacillus texcoconensis]
MDRKLVLENSAVFEGKGFGANVESMGEVVFQTGMTGYQEVVSNPSNCGQIVTMTYPLIGNAGVNRDDFENMISHIHGLIVKKACHKPSHFRSERSLHEYLQASGIPAIEGIDTRRLTKEIRTYGTIRGAIVPGSANTEEVVFNLKQSGSLHDQVSRVSTKSVYASPGNGKRVVVIDYGMKKAILKQLIQQGFDVVVVPYNTKAEDVLTLNPDGVVLSNGPGDPEDIPEAEQTVSQLIGEVPLFGICLGHQLLSRASGADTKKMLFGHRGANHPVKDLESKNVALTSQNHSYIVDEESMSQASLTVTHRNVNDGTIEGVRHTYAPAFGVQFHPEATPGPHDSFYLFERFHEMIESFDKEEKQEGLYAKA